MKTLVVVSVYKETPSFEFLEFWESLTTQSFQDFTLCLYIDGIISNDLELCLERLLLSSLFPVKLIRSTNNRGLATALNSMILWGLCNDYDIFIRADSDDRFPPYRFHALITFLVDNPTIDAVGSNYRYFGIRQGSSCLPIKHNEIKSRFSYALAIGHATVAFRRTFFELAGFYEQGFHNRIEDQRLWASAFRNNCKIANINQVLYEVRVTQGLLLRRASFSEKTELFLIRARHILTQFPFTYKFPYLILALVSYSFSILLIILVIPIRLFSIFTNTFISGRPNGI